uniref:Uncharacterized protein n=1 Tax=Meloidogyne enterolobii TaxID=390850 RepID=A0A6V7XAZ5_MELEN|nr:unnamed protein product [Meloidogyne enterolobii]
MEFLTLMTWGVEDGVPFIPEPLPVELAQPELVIVDEEPEPAAPTVGEENACEAKEEQKPTTPAFGVPVEEKFKEKKKKKRILMRRCST